MILAENFQFITLFLLTIIFIYVIISSLTIAWLIIELKAFKKSTHNVEYVPLDSNWATSEKDISDLNEKSEMEMPPLDFDEMEESEIDLNKMI